jgi:hypothetical protein
MASMKNTIVLGCFILASVVAHAFLSDAFLSGRYEGHIDSDFGAHRFDTRTGQFYKWERGKKPTFMQAEAGQNPKPGKWHQVTED